MNHKKALKKLMGIDFDRNTANKLLRQGVACGHTNAWVVTWQTTVNAIIQFASRNPINWCPARKEK